MVKTYNIRGHEVQLKPGEGNRWKKEWKVFIAGTEIGTLDYREDPAASPEVFNNWRVFGIHDYVGGSKNAEVALGVLVFSVSRLAFPPLPTCSTRGR